MGSPPENVSQRLDEGETLRAFLETLFAGHGLCILGERPARYRCDCSRRRVEQALISMGEAELRDMIDRDGGAELTCQSCRKTYQFTAAQLDTLLARAMKGTGIGKR